jgi:hypothetical protein
MNQKTAQGQRLIDQAKTAVENFINKVRCRDPSARTDQYVLITTQEDGTGIRVNNTVQVHFRFDSTKFLNRSD